MNDTDRRRSRNQLPSTPHGGSPRRPPEENFWGSAEDAAWRTIGSLLKGLEALSVAAVAAALLIWALFVVLSVPADVSSLRHAKRPAIGVAEEKGQLLLELSELIVSACSYRSLDTAEGRAGCQALCRDHMCCFVDGPGAAVYGCADDPKRTCPAHAGCQALVVPEEEAVIFDVDGIEVFGTDSIFLNPDGVVVVGNDSSSPGDRKKDVATATPPKQFQQEQVNQHAAITNYTQTSELQLTKHVVEAVCADDNLRSDDGMQDCAALCGPSMCCFDRDDIVTHNPRLDLALNLKLSSSTLDLSELGTCLGEEDDGNVTTAGHFCGVHAGCKNLLLSASAAAVEQLFSSTDPLQQRMLLAVCVIFGAVVGVTVCLEKVSQDADSPRPPPAARHQLEVGVGHDAFEAAGLPSFCSVPTAKQEICVKDPGPNLFELSPSVHCPLRK